MDSVAKLSINDRKDLFYETSVKMKTTPAIIEKDFWVVWVLDKIFSDDFLKDIFMFKGGTSLSKVYDLIGRFSEDIDLILDWREVIDENPNKQRASKNQQVKFNEKVNKLALSYINEKLLPIVSKLVSPLCECEIDKNNPFNINIKYPSIFEDNYLRPLILLEIGPLASWLPFDKFNIQSYASQYFPDIFKKAKCDVYAIVAKRTFWEKATILHQEFHRVQEKSLPLRYSRHYYDLAIMAKSPVKDEALSDMQLLKEVVEFKKKFYPSAWANFDEAKQGTLKLVPPSYRVKELQKDYKAMGGMIFSKKLSFDEIIEILTELEKDINNPYKKEEIGK